MEKSSVHREGFLSDGKEYKTKSTRVHNVKDIAPERSGPTDGRVRKWQRMWLWVSLCNGELHPLDGSGSFRSHWNERECETMLALLCFHSDSRTDFA